jgi:hypothetical protein
MFIHLGIKYGNLPQWNSYDYSCRDGNTSYQPTDEIGADED